MRPALCLLFSNERNSDTYALVDHPDWLELTKLRPREMIRVAAAITCQVACSRAEAMYGLCVKWKDYYVGAMGEASDPELFQSYSNKTLPAVQEVMTEGVDLGKLSTPSPFTTTQFNIVARQFGLILPSSLYANVRYTRYLGASPLERLLTTRERLLHRAVFGPDLVLPFSCALSYENPFALVSDRYNPGSMTNYPEDTRIEGEINSAIGSMYNRSSLYLSDGMAVGLFNGLISQTGDDEMTLTVYTRKVEDDPARGVELSRSNVVPPRWTDARNLRLMITRPGFIRTFDGKRGLWRFYSYAYAPELTPHWCLTPEADAFKSDGLGTKLRLADLAQAVGSVPRVISNSYAPGALPRRGLTQNSMPPGVTVQRQFTEAEQRLRELEKLYKEAREDRNRAYSDLTSQLPSVVPRFVLPVVQDHVITGEEAHRQADLLRKQQEAIAHAVTTSEVNASDVPAPGESLLDQTETPPVVPGILQSNAGAAVSSQDFRHGAGN